MWERSFNRNLTFSSLFGWLIWITGVAVVSADGRVFLLDLRNTSDSQELAAAEHACVSHGARLASAEELRHAVVECSFSECTRGWLHGGTVGTTVCSNVGSVLKAVDVKTENATEDATRLHAFCVKDRGVPCGDPPSFPNTRLQGHTGFELGDELLYSCLPGHVMPGGHTVFSLLCDSCGEWYGLVQLCVKDGTETHIDYEDKFTGDHHLAYEDPEDLSEDERLEEAQGEVQEEAHEPTYEGEEEHGSQEQQEASFSVEGGEDMGEEEEEAGGEDGGEEDGGEETAAPEEEGEDRGGEEMSVGEEQPQEEEEEGLLTGGEEEEEVVDSSDSPGEEQEEVLGTVAGVVTEAPVSLLSQKHLFWFPSEAFQEAGHPVATQPPIIQTTPSDGDNRVKASGSDTKDVKDDDSQKGDAEQPDEHVEESHIELEDHDEEDLDSHEETDPGVHVEHEHIDHGDHDDIVDHDDAVDVDHDDHDKHVDHEDGDGHEEPDNQSKHDHEKGGRYDDDDDHEEHYDMGEHEDDRDSVLYGKQGEHVVREDDHDGHEHEPFDHDDVTDDHTDHSEEHSDPDSHPDDDDHDRSDDHDTSDERDKDSDHDRYDDHDDHEHDDHDSDEDHRDHEDYVEPPVAMPTDDPQNVTQEGTGTEPTASTEELWLDGYPVVPDEMEKVGGSSTEDGPGSEELEEELIVKGTDSPNEVEMSQPTMLTSFSQSPSQGAEEGWPGLAYTTSPDRLSPESTDSPSDPDTDDYTTAPGNASPTETWEDVTTDHHFLDHDLQPTARDDDITGLEEERTDRNVTQRAREEEEEEEDGVAGGAACTEEDCPPPPPPSSGRGPTVAAIVVAVCVVAVAAVAGAWCYRRRQQKTSMYEMNGKGQSQSAQQIEMQQKV